MSKNPNNLEQTLKPEVAWSPDLHVTAENWDALQDQGWLWDSNREGTAKDIKRRIFLVRNVGLQNVLDGDEYDEKTQSPKPSQDDLERDSTTSLGLYYRPSVASLMVSARLEERNATGKYVPKDEVSQYLDNPYEARRLDEAIIEGVFDKAVSDYDIVRESERLALAEFE